MSESSASSSSGGIGFLRLLAIVFITLKLLGITEVATWSWWWVLAPIWGGAILVILILAACLAFALWVELRK
jgi:hypothetical protein